METRRSCKKKIRLDPFQCQKSSIIITAPVALPILLEQQHIDTREFYNNLGKFLKGEIDIFIIYSKSQFSGRITLTHAIANMFQIAHHCLEIEGCECKDPQFDRYQDNNNLGSKTNVLLVDDRIHVNNAKISIPNELLQHPLYKFQFLFTLAVKPHIICSMKPIMYTLHLPKTIKDPDNIVFQVTEERNQIKEMALVTFKWNRKTELMFILKQLSTMKRDNSHLTSFFRIRDLLTIVVDYLLS